MLSKFVDCEDLVILLFNYIYFLIIIKSREILQLFHFISLF